MHGFQINVIPFYSKASLFLMTSEYEGYPLTLQESMLAGLPIVMYSLPHLSLVNNNKGIISVAQRDVEDAARNIVELLLDDSKRKTMGKESRRYIDSFKDYDYNGIWSGIFDSLLEMHKTKDISDEGLMMEEIVTYHKNGLDKRRDAMRYGGRKTVKYAMKIVKLKDYINEYGMRLLIENSIRKIKDSTHENGLKYTLKKIKQKII